MSKPTEEELIAYVDGRLDGPALAAFEEKLRTNPDLADRVAAHRWMTQQIVAAYGAPPAEANDEALAARLGLMGDTVAPTPNRHLPVMRRSLVAFLTSGALAASLVIGVSIGTRQQQAAVPWLKASGTGQLTARGALADSLSQRLSGQSGPVRIGISFRTAQGICRTFSADNGISGLGCREHDQWVVPIVVGSKPEPDGASTYQLAGGRVAPPVMDEVDQLIKGAPLSPTEEQALKAKGWQ